MRKRSRREIEEYDAGDYVRVKIPRVDRRRLGGKSLVCKVVETLGGVNTSRNIKHSLRS